MRLLIATPLYPPELGGPATYAARMAGALPALGMAVKVQPFSAVRRFPRVARHAVYLFQLLRHARHADALYALDALSVGVPALFAARLVRIPLVVRIGGLGSHERATERGCAVDTPHAFSAQVGGLSLMLRLMFWFERLVLRAAHAVVVPSEYLRQALAASGVPQERVTVVHNGVGPARQGMHGPRTPRLVIAAGRLVALKRLETLIEAIALLRADLPDIRLDVYGEGPSRAFLETCIRDHNLTGIVRLLPPVSRAALSERMRQASALALPSEHETFSNLILEAMVAGLPVVSTTVGGTPEMIENGKTGVLVPPLDAPLLARALRRVLTDEAYARTIAASAAASIARFSEEAMVARTVQVLREAVQ